MSLPEPVFDANLRSPRPMRSLFIPHGRSHPRKRIMGTIGRNPSSSRSGRAGLGAHQTIAIFGCGPLGLLLMALAKAYGAKKVIVFDIDQARIDFALKYAADVGIACELNTQGQEPLSFATEAVERVTKEHGLGAGVDVAIDASGSENGIQMGVVMTKPSGTYVQAGLSKPLTSVPMFLSTAKELTVKGWSKNERLC